MNSTFTQNFKSIRKKVNDHKKEDRNGNEDEDEDDNNFAAFSPVETDDSEIETDDENDNVEDESDLESVITYPSDQSDTEDERKHSLVKCKVKKLLPGSLPTSKNFKILQEDNDFEDE